MTVQEYTLYEKWVEVHEKYKTAETNSFFDDKPALIDPTQEAFIKSVKNNIWTPESPDDVEKLEPVLEFTDDTEYNFKGQAKRGDLSEKWNTLRTFLSTMKNNSNIGRQLFFLVKDNRSGKYLGVICISGDFMDLTPRDNYIGWDRDIKTFKGKINHTAIGSTIVPLQPLGFNYVGGKLLAWLDAAAASFACEFCDTPRMVTKSIERAQKKVEENNFGIRKRLLEYDDVMNSQRNIIYTLRKNALEGDRLQIDISNIMFDTIDEIIRENKGTNNYKNFEFELITTFSMSSPVDETEFLDSIEKILIDKFYQELNTFYINKKELNRTLAFPVIKNVYENKSNSFKRIVVPFTDGKKVINIVTDLKKSYDSEGENLIYDFEKNISLAIIDEKWKNHLRKMDELKQSVQLAVHEQKDPLLIYKFEAYELFKSMIHILNKELLSFLFKSNLPDNQANIKDASSNVQGKNYNTTKEESLNSDELAERARRVGANVNQRSQKVETITRNIPKIGRNEKVEIKNSSTGETQTLKFKQAENLLHTGEWELNS